MTSTIAVIVVIYMAVMIGIGFYARRKITDSEGYHLAGRRLGVLMLAGTLAATEIGGGSSVGVASKAYGDWGLSEPDGTSSVRASASCSLRS